MTASEIELQRRRDAALLENWSEWESLDDLPVPDKRFGHFAQRPERHNLYWCVLRHKVGPSNGPGFELCLPENIRICRMIETVPGVHQQRGRYHNQAGNYLVPAEHWQRLRAVLPALKAAVCEFARKPR